MGAFTVKYDGADLGAIQGALPSVTPISQKSHTVITAIDCHFLSSIVSALITFSMKAADYYSQGAHEKPAPAQRAEQCDTAGIRIGLAGNELPLWMPELYV